MQAVLLMAGKGSRMAKDYEGPKQLLPVAGKPILEYILDSLPAAITELVFVVGGPHEQTIRDHFSSGEYDGRTITFVVQEEQLGLAHAFWTTKDIVQGRFLGMVSDDLFDPKALEEMLEHDLSVLASHSDHPENFGVFIADEEGYLVKSVEKPKEFVSDLISNGAMVMDERFMNAEVAPSARGEYETPDVWQHLIDTQGAKIKIVESGFWLPINDKEQLDEAARILTER